MKQLNEKVAIVTGGTRGIGLEIARLFYENNAKVIIFGSKEESVNKAIEDLKKENIFVNGYYPDLLKYDEINAGVGSLNIDLQGEKDSYKIQANKGLGSIKIDGKELPDGESFGNGENYIEVDGGVGNIKIDFAV